ncbi:MAG: 50S ribosomal protein L17 [Chlorobiota bacterium]|nr:50S ribosomal protein L17 [Chlorobiota bacterium]QQS65746.1 MAG: 50S ribosomal protein L17 [Chlorobiota bacterium]
MRHRYSGRKLGRTASHRSALLRTLATSLLKHKKIKTTEAKAKETRMFAEAIITRAKLAYLSELNGGPKDTHARRMIARDVNDPEVVKTLMNDIAPKVANRNGGYTRVIKLGTRLGDAARIAIIELVDYNSDRDEKSASNKSKSTISRAERVARSKKVATTKEVKTEDNSNPNTESSKNLTNEETNS